MYRPLLFIHRWSGIIAAACLVAAGLSGSAITFRAELERVLNAESMQVETSADPIDADALVARMSSRYPDAWISAVIPGSDAWAFTLAKPGARAGTRRRLPGGFAARRACRHRRLSVVAAAQPAAHSRRAPRDTHRR